VAICNHSARYQNLDLLVEEVLRIGSALIGGSDVVGQGGCPNGRPGMFRQCRLHSSRVAEISILLTYSFE